jgi:3-hydroxybutyryl-CoA dehydratase
MVPLDGGDPMASSTPLTRGLYFEDFKVGDSYTTPGRTVTEADIVAFASLTGDFNLIHTDAVYAAGSAFGQRVAHGMLGASYAIGLAVRTGILEGTVLAFREIKEWKFTQPIHIGDTIHVEIQVGETKPFPRLGGGMVTLDLNVLNQEAVSVMKGSLTVLIMSRG